MGFYSVWPYFVCMGVIFWLASTPALRLADAPPSDGAGRIGSIDGLRGVLALGVFFHHAALTRGFLLDGVWALPPSAFYALLGQTGVAVFFMITGYLFWARLLKHGGRVGLRDLYIGRAFRIGPLYLFALTAAIGVVFTDTGWMLRVPAGVLAGELLRYLALGVFGAGPGLNGSTLIPILGMAWTLHYEWLFYLSLLITAFLARRPWHLPVVASLWAACLAWVAVDGVAGLGIVCAALFLTGMLCASLQPTALARGPGRSWAIAVLLVIEFRLHASVYNLTSILLLGGGFYLIVLGSTFFGLLTATASRRLGAISYGIYLLQGFVLHLVFATALLRGFALAGPWHYWAVVLGAALLLVAMATIAHAAIERPGIELGKILIARLAGAGRTLPAGTAHASARQ